MSGKLSFQRRQFRMLSRQENPNQRISYKKSKYFNAKHKHKALYGSRGWRTLRTRMLKTNPLCTYCGSLATEVDHIVPHRGDHTLFYDSKNLQPICYDCHRTKSGAGM